MLLGMFGKVAIFLSLSAIFSMALIKKTTTDVISKPLTRVMMGGGFGKSSKTVKPSKSDTAGFGGSNKFPKVTQESTTSSSTKLFQPISSNLLPDVPLDKVQIANFSDFFNLKFPKLRCINADPPIFEIQDFLSSEICDDYIKRAENKGVQVASRTFSRQTSAARTSTTWYMHYKDVTEFLDKALKLTGVPLTRCEEPQIVRYEFGQQFSW